MDREEILRLMHGLHRDDEAERSDQQKGVPLPPAEKSAGSVELVGLPDPFKTKLVRPSVTDCIRDRKSVRSFEDSPLSLGELSYLLWATQGIKEAGEGKLAHHAVRRTVPSAGSRHPFETYVISQSTSGLKPGVYRYVASKNSLAVVGDAPVSQEAVAEALCGQTFCAKAPVLFIWTAIPYRTEWRYGAKRSMKVILLDAGHVGQNLHLACEALGLGTCMIGAYFQDLADKLVKADGKEEFSIYMAPAGKRNSGAVMV